MKVTAQGDVAPLGWTSGNLRAALKFKATAGEDLILEFPADRLAELSLIAMQIAAMSARRAKRPFEPPLLPVAAWSAGPDPETGDIALRFDYPQAGARGFRVDRAKALALHKALGDVLATRKGAN